MATDDLTYLRVATESANTIRQLRADLEAARAENAVLKAHASMDATAVTHLIAESVQLRADLAQAWARLQQALTVVEAARSVAGYFPKWKFVMLNQALQALDAATATPPPSTKSPPGTRSDAFTEIQDHQGLELADGSRRGISEG